MTGQAYAEHLQAQDEARVKRLKQQRYRAKRMRRLDRPQGNGPERPCGLPVIEDKRLQAACASILQASYAQACLGWSDGDWPERGAGDVVRDLTVARP